MDKPRIENTEWTAEGHEAARRDHIEGHEAIEAAFGDRRIQVQAGDDAWFILGATDDDVILFVILDRVRLTAIWQITLVRRATLAEVELWEKGFKL